MATANNTTLLDLAKLIANEVRAGTRIGLSRHTFDYLAHEVWFRMHQRVSLSDLMGAHGHSQLQLFGVIFYVEE